MGIGHSTGAFRFRVLRLALDIPPEHSNFECSGGHWAFHPNIQISNAQMCIGHSTVAFRFRMLILGIGHSNGAFRFRMLRWALGIPPEHSDFES